MRFGTVGTGWIVAAFLEGAALAGGWDWVAAYSREEGRGNAFADAHKGASPAPEVFTDLERMASDTSLDTVYIASPNSLHAAQSALFLRHGKHVLCEKPIAVTGAQYRANQELAAAHGCVYMEAIMMRHLPARTILWQALPRLGRITGAQLDFSQLSSKYAALRGGALPNIFNPAMAAGCLMDLGIYCVYPALEWFGEPCATQTTAGYPAWAHAAETGKAAALADGWGTSVYTYPDKQATLTYSKVGQSRLGSQLLGDEATLVIDSISCLTGMRLIYADGRTEMLVGDIPRAELMSGEARAFREYVDGAGCADERYRQDAALAQRVCDQLEAMRAQAGIVFPPEAFLSSLR